MSKVYGYRRLALADNNEIAEQMRMVEKYCENNNLKLDGYFCDNGCNGFKYAKADGPKAEPFTAFIDEFLNAMKNEVKVEENDD